MRHGQRHVALLLCLCVAAQSIAFAAPVGGGAPPSLHPLQSAMAREALAARLRWAHRLLGGAEAALRTLWQATRLAPSLVLATPDGLAPEPVSDDVGSAARWIQTLLNKLSHAEDSARGGPRFTDKDGEDFRLFVQKSYFLPAGRLTNVAARKFADLLNDPRIELAQIVARRSGVIPVAQADELLVLANQFREQRKRELAVTTAVGEATTLIPDATVFRAEEGVPIPARLEVANSVLAAGLSTRLVGKILAGVTRQSTAGFDEMGRSLHLTLGPAERFRLGGREYRQLKIKLVTYRGQAPEPVAYVADDAEYLQQPTHKLEVDSDGLMHTVPAAAKPRGGGFLSEAIHEFRLMEAIRQAGIPTGLPVGVGCFTGLTFEGKPLGFVVMALETDEDPRPGIEFHKTMERVEGTGVFREVPKILRQLSVHTGLAAKTLRQLHDHGFVHSHPHMGNFGVPIGHRAPVYDLTNAKSIEAMSREEYITRVFNDFRHLVYGTYATVSQGQGIDFYSQIVARTQVEPSPIQQVVLGYFTDADKELIGRQRFTAATSDVKLLYDIHRILSVSLDGRRLTDFGTDIVPIFRQIAGARYDRLTQASARSDAPPSGSMPEPPSDRAATLVDEIRAAARDMNTGGETLGDHGSSNSQAHFERMRENIRQAIDAAPDGRSAAVFGAGLLRDVPDELFRSPKFPRLFLVDIDAELIRRALAQRGLADQIASAENLNGKIHVIEADLSQVSPVFAGRIESAIASAGDIEAARRAVLAVFKDVEEGRLAIFRLSPPAGLDSDLGLVTSQNVASMVAISVLLAVNRLAAKRFGLPLPKDVIESPWLLTNEFAPAVARMTADVPQAQAALWSYLTQPGAVLAVTSNLAQVRTRNTPSFLLTELIESFRELARVHAGLSRYMQQRRLEFLRHVRREFDERRLQAQVMWSLPQVVLNDPPEHLGRPNPWTQGWKILDTEFWLWHDRPDQAKALVIQSLVMRRESDAPSPSRYSPAGGLFGVLILTAALAAGPLAKTIALAGTHSPRYLPGGLSGRKVPVAKDLRTRLTRRAA